MNAVEKAIHVDRANHRRRILLRPQARYARFRQSLAEHALDSRLDDRQVLENFRDGPSVGAWLYIAPGARDAADSGTQAFVLSIEMAQQFFGAWMHVGGR